MARVRKNKGKKTQGSQEREVQREPRETFLFNFERILIIFERENLEENRWRASKRIQRDLKK